MRKLLHAILVTTVFLAGCDLHFRKPQDSQSQNPAGTSAVEAAVKTFAQTVAHDVTQDGPSAWRKHFEDSSAFFMAVNGQMAFVDSAAATAGIQAFAPTIKKIELHWGDDLRVDALTPNFAVVAATYHEIWDATSGQHVDSTGFFTGTAEFRDGRWQFRDAHWSVPVPPPPTK